MKAKDRRTRNAAGRGNALPALTSRAASAGFNRAVGALRNRRQVLRLLCRHGPLSQRRLTEFTGLQRSTIFYIVRDLTERGLLSDAGTLAATRVGPKETLCEIAPGAAWAAGVSLTSTGYRISLVNGAGHIVAQRVLAASTKLAEDLDEMPAAIDQLASHSGLRGSAYVGLSVCVPGIVNARAGVVLNSSSLSLRDFALGTELQRRVGGDVAVERNAVCGAYAEQYRGGWGAADHFLYLLVREAQQLAGGRVRLSLGLAIVEGGEIYRGANSAAGELSGPFFPGGTGRMPELLLTPGTARDRAEAEALREAMGTHLGALVNLFDPQLVVIAADERLFSKQDLATIMNAAQREVTPVAGRTLRIGASTLGLDGIAHGAALMALHRGLMERVSVT